MKKRPVRSFIFILMVASALVGAACSGDDSVSAGGDGGAADSSRVSDQSAEGAGLTSEEELSDEAVGKVSAASAAVTETPELGPNVIKTADLKLEVPKDEFRDAVTKATGSASSFGGFVLTTDVSETRSGTIILRVPAENFDAVLGELRALGDLKGEAISGRDVSEEFVDLQARLRNLEAQETVLLRLMDRAQTVSATIKVQRELSGVQMEVERLRGRIRFLDDQTSFSTITLNLVRADLAPPEPAGALGRAWENAKDTFVAVVSAVVVGAGFVLPVAFLLALIALAYRALRPRLSQGA